MDEVPSDVDLDAHWAEFGRFVAAYLIEHAEERMSTLAYRYWEGVFPEAESVDGPVDETCDALWDHQQVLLRLSWWPGSMTGDTTETVAALQFGDVRVLARAPNAYDGLGWVAEGIIDGDPRNFVGGALLEALNISNLFPDGIESVIPTETVRAILRSLLDGHGDDSSAWDNVAEKVGMVGADHDAVLDRYVAERVSTSEG